MQLLIDVLPNTSPPKFTWVHNNIKYTGSLQPSVENAVLTLIRQHKQLTAENEELRRVNLALTNENSAVPTSEQPTAEQTPLPTKHRGR